MSQRALLTRGIPLLYRSHIATQWRELEDYLAAGLRGDHAELRVDPETDSVDVQTTLVSLATAGKTIGRRLTETEADLYRDWIDNRHRLEQVITQMEEISAAAAELLLPQTNTSQPSQHRKR